MTISVSLLPDADSRCQILDGDARCERYSLGAKLTGALTTGTLIEVKLCNTHAAAMAALVDGDRIIGGTKDEA